MRINVRCQVVLSRYELARQCSNTCANLQHTISNKRSKPLGHPLIKTSCVLKLGEDARTILIFHVKIVDQPEVNHRSQCPQTISCCDLFFFFTSSRLVLEGGFY